MPPAAAAPIVLLPIAPGPEASISGINPAINANDVIKIGRKRAAAPSTADSKTVAHAACLCTANSTIKTAFLPKIPINITIAICA